MFDPETMSSAEVSRAWLIAASDLGPDGPLRAQRAWLVTCLVDAWAGGNAPLIPPPDHTVSQQCVEWSALPTTVMQSRGTKTPFTVGMNSQMVVTMWGNMQPELARLFPGATKPQIDSALSCIVDAARVYGMEQALSEMMADNSPCFRLAMLTDAQKQPPRKAGKNGKQARKPQSTRPSSDR